MNKIRRRRPRVAFSQIPNAVLRDYRLSWRARGLLAELLSYPADYVISVDELVRRARRVSGATEGRDAMRAAVRELKNVGYIVSTKRQDAQGRWVTEVEVTDDPAYDMPNPPLDSAAVTPAHEPDADVSAGRTDDGIPGVGEPGVGEPGVNKNTEKKTEISSSSYSSSIASESADDHGRKEEEEEKETKETTSSPIEGTGSPLTSGSDSTSQGTRKKPLEALIVDECGATPEEAADLINHIRRTGEARLSLSGYVRHLVANGDMEERLRRLRAARTALTPRRPADELKCALHRTPMPGGTCICCAADIKAGDADDVVDYYRSLTPEERDARADLKHLLESRGLIGSGAYS